MKFTAETNVLVRAFIGDEPRQRQLAQEKLLEADLVAVTLPTLCELVWVLLRGYRISAVEVTALLRRLIDSANVVSDRPAVEAGLATLESGGDFADGVIAFEGRRLGADTLLTFDRHAAKLLGARGQKVELLK